MPTVSPGRSAGGLTSCGREAGIELESDKEEFSLTNQARRSAQENGVPFPADGLRASGRVDFDRGFGVTGSHGSDGRGAGSGPGRLRFSRATLEKTRADIVPAVERDEFDVDSFL